MMPEQINRALLTLLGSQELANKWWNSPNSAFNREIPRDVYQKDKKEVIAYLSHVLSF